MNVNQSTIFDRIVGALKSDPALTETKTEMLDPSILHNPGQLVRSWVPHEIVGLRLQTPEGIFDVTVAQVKAETASANPG